MKNNIVDKNLVIETAIDEPDVKWYSVLEEPFDIYGLYRPKQDGIFRRMPAETALKVNNGVAKLYTNTAGGRIRFKTDSPYIQIKVEYKNLCYYSHMPMANAAGFDVHRFENGKLIYHKLIMPNMDDITGYARKIEATGTMTEYVFGMPLYNNISNIYIGTSKTAKLEHGSKYTIEKPIVYYGSSITQGACASRPFNSYQGYISERFDADYINLGFSGSAKGEQIMLDYIASLEMSAFVYDYDHNSGYEELKSRHIEGYKTVRAAHPDLPIIIVARPLFNPEDNGGEKTEVVHKTYEYALKQNDKNVAYVPSFNLCDGDYKFHCTVDNLHPNDIGFYRMAQKIGDALKPFIEKM